MALFRRAAPNIPASEYIPRRPPATALGTAVVTNETALRHSAVWACLRLRANLISTMPMDVFRRVNGIQIQQSTFVNPGGTALKFHEWMYDTQFDLDRAGNAFGVITERWHVSGLPRTIQLVPLSQVSVKSMGGAVEFYRIAGQPYDPHDIWHERQYTVSGLPIGLSPVAYAAWSIGEYLSIQDFAMGWFGSGGVPKAMLKNTTKPTLTASEATDAKERFKSTVASGDLFVAGADWEYQMIQAEQTGKEWVEEKRSSMVDIARFFDCPADLIDAAVSGQSVTYANITQRNLQLLIMHLGPAIIRREYALNDLYPIEQYVKFNTDALLRMDPLTRAQMMKLEIDTRLMTPDEGREILNRKPLTQEQIDQFNTLWPPNGGFNNNSYEANHLLPLPQNSNNAS